MTINRKFDTVTFWDAKAHRHYVLEGRIKATEIDNLKMYLSPKLTQEEKEEFQKLRDSRAKAREEARKSLASLADGTHDGDTVKGGAADDGDEDFDNLPNDDDEGQSDSSFMDNVDVMAKYEDLN